MSQFVCTFGRKKLLNKNNFVNALFLRFRSSSKSDDATQPVYFGRPGSHVKIGIVGLPNVGKSSFFNLLSKMNVPAENFPFCTIDPNSAVVPIPDDRFDWLCKNFQPASKVPPMLNVTDIAGLVRGANEGAGLGNEFLSHISSTDAIYQMIRGFNDENVTHVEGEVNPLRDRSIIEEELMLKDMSIVERSLELSSRSKRASATQEKIAECKALEKALNILQEELTPIRYAKWTLDEVNILNRYHLFTSKEVVFLLNLSKEDYLNGDNPWISQLEKDVNNQGGGMVIPFSVDFEQQWLAMEDNGTLHEYQQENPTHKSAIPKILWAGYKALNLIHFFTCGKDEVKAWSIREGWLAPQAAGVIHSDFEKGFITAEVTAFEHLKECGSEEAAKKNGKSRAQGKKYVVQDGDIMLFRFNV